MPLSLNAARHLAGAAQGRLSIRPLPEDGLFELAAGDHVGTLATQETDILVRPKIPLDNLFVMLDAGVPVEAWRPETFRYGADRALLPAFASFFCRTVDTAIARGLLHAYRPEELSLPGIRGRIDFARLTRRVGPLSVMPCRFEDFTADIAENRGLRAAVQRLRRVFGIPTSARQGLTRALAQLEDVADVAMTAAELDRLPITRLNAHYRPSLRLAALVLEGTSLIDRPGGFATSAFMLNMNNLFERFVTQRVRQHLDQRWRLVAQDPWKLDLGGRVKMFPDLVFYGAGRSPVYVADIKYKITSGGFAENADYYQLLAYTVATGVDEGLLIYCQHDGNPPPREITVKSVGKRIVTYPLDLAGSPADVEASMLGLVKWVEERLTRSDVAAIGADRSG